MKNNRSTKFSLIIGILLAVFFLVTKDLNAAEAKLENVSFTVLSENVIVINYDLIGPGKKYVVELNLRRKGLPYYSFTPQAVTGDIGKGKFAGTNRKIVWSLENENDPEFYIDPYSSDFYFTVSVRKKGGATWLIPTGVLGLVVFVVVNVTGDLGYF